MKILHSADWHFRERDHDEIEKCVAFILGRAVQQKPDLICISGDITDSRHLDFDSKSARSIINIITAMLDVAPVAVVIGTPSHDGKAALALRECRGKYPILVSDMPGQWIYNIDSNGIFDRINDDTGQVDSDSFIITQIPQPTKQYFVNDMAIEDTDKAISNAMDSIFASFGSVAEKFDTIPHIVNGHGQIGGAFISETQQLIGRDIEVSKSQLAMLNADLICYGHVHLSQKIGEKIFYAGSPTRMNFGETEDKGFYIHNIGDWHNSETGEEGNGYTHSEFIKTPAIYLHDAKFDLTKEESLIDFHSELGFMCEGISSDYDEWGTKITITAWQDEAKEINKAEIERDLIDWGASRVNVSLIRKPRESVRAERVLAADTLPDKIEAMAELRGEEVSKSVLDKAKDLEAGEMIPWKGLKANGV